MYVDEVYYHDMFRGEPVDDTDFLALCQRAGEIIEEMTLYRLTEEGFAMMPENTQKLVKNAVCAQIEYLDANGGAEMDMGNGMSGATLGKFSYSGASSGSGSTEQSIFSPRAERILWPTGLTYRGGRY
nr:MAG TPA: Head Tail Connector Protein [Caudoviricetes sp.]